jgi:hypothetical protein
MLTLQVTTFTDCVNCLIAFTNNPHSLDVSLNAIAFLRFCAMKLAEGAIGGSPPSCISIQDFLNCPGQTASGFHRLHTHLEFHDCQALLRVQMCQDFGS